MKKLILAAGAAMIITPAAFAQTTTPAPTYDPAAPAPAPTYDPAVPAPAYDPAAPQTTSYDPAPTGDAPDGSTAFGIKPYIGILGGYQDFDSDNRGPLTTNCNGSSGCADGGFVEAVAGVNVPLGPVFVGAEGNVAKGFNGLDWQYGAYGRAGVRAGDSGIIYGKVGYQWIETEDSGDDDGISYGLGVEVGPQDIGLGGITGNAGIRLRLEVTTFDLQDIRPAAGVVFHF